MFALKPLSPEEYRPAWPTERSDPLRGSQGSVPESDRGSLSSVEKRSELGFGCVDWFMYDSPAAKITVPTSEFDLRQSLA